MAKIIDNLKQEINLQEAVTNKLIMGNSMNKNAKIIPIRDSYAQLFKEEQEEQSLEEQEEQSLEEQRRLFKG